MTDDYLWLARMLKENKRYKNCRHMIVILARNAKRLRANGV